jgi:16S rRNA pseudouridine516 synthase
LAKVRIDRLLGNLGYGTRKDAQRIVKSGRVTVDGEVVTDATRSVDPEAVTLDGEPLDSPLGLVVALYKPVGYVCSHSDREGPPVFDLLPEQWMLRSPRPTTVGRLDMDSSGLVLVTDDGALVHALTAPRRHVQKRYVVTLDREPGADLTRLVEQFASGTLMLRGEDTPCRPAVSRRSMRRRSRCCSPKVAIVKCGACSPISAMRSPRCCARTSATTPSTVSPKANGATSDAGRYGRMTTLIASSPSISPASVWIASSASARAN